MTKILSIFNHYVERGGEAYAVEAIQQSLSKIFKLDSCEFYSSDWSKPSGAPAQWKQALWMIRNPASIAKLRASHQRFHPDCWLVHNVFPVGSAAIYSEAARQRVPVVQYLHNFRPFSVSGYLWAGERLAPGGLSRNYWQEIRHAAWQGSHAKTAWLAFVLSVGHAIGLWKEVKAWIAVSEFMRQKFVGAGIPPQKIFTLRHFWKPRSSHSDTSEGTYYLFLGRLITAKGILVLLDAWEILERELGRPAPRLLIGGEGPLRSVVAARSERMNSVDFAGQISGEAKSRALAECRAVIVPSLWWEPLGLVVYEAYEYSKPVLAAFSGGLPEIVINQTTGLLHNPGNAEQLARQVLELESENLRRREMGQKGRVWLELNASEGQWREKFSEIAAYALTVHA